MIIARQLTLEEWHPISSLWPDRPAPTWTRLKCDGIELSNSIECADWKSDPINLIVCETCLDLDGWCQLAHLVRTDDQLLWMQPYYSRIPGLALDDLDRRSVENSILMDRALWDEVSWQFDDMPGFDTVRRITRRDLHHLWKQQLPAYVPRGLSSSQRLEFYRMCLASHPLEGPSAIDLALEMLDAPEPPEEPLSGVFVPVDPNSSDFQSYYFDGDQVSEWRAFTSCCPRKLVVANQWVLDEKRA